MEVIISKATGFNRRDIWQYLPICLKTDKVVFVKIGALIKDLSFFSFKFNLKALNVYYLHFERNAIYLSLFSSTYSSTKSFFNSSDSSLSSEK